MKIEAMFSHEKLEVYQKACETNRMIYRLLQGDQGIARYVQDQLGRASLSIVLNIAEGSGRFSNKDRRKFFIHARGSAAECAAIIHFLQDEGKISPRLRQELYTLYEEISKILYVMIENLTKKALAEQT